MCASYFYLQCIDGYEYELFTVPDIYELQNVQQLTDAKFRGVGAIGTCWFVQLLPTAHTPPATHF